MGAHFHKNPPGDKAREEEIRRALRSSRTRAEAAAALGIGLGALDHACKVYGVDIRAELGKGESAAVQDLPPAGLTRDELVAHLKTRYARLNAREEASRLIGVNVKGSLPIGLCAFGDLHIDDPGCDIAQVEADANTVRETPGMYGVALGDFTNNWVGRLQKLYGAQSVTQTEGWELVGWFFDLVRDWLVAVKGNHDCWTGPGSPLDWIAKGAGVFAKEHDVRFALRFANGAEVRVHARHDFPGRSIYNESHGPLRAAIFGSRDHVKIAGHTHVSSYQLVPEPEGSIAMHLVRVAGYKKHDGYALEGGFHRKSLGPSAVLVIDPRLPNDHPDLIKVWWSVQEAAEFLRWARSRKVAA